jgi:hypothetical protein
MGCALLVGESPAATPVKPAGYLYFVATDTGVCHCSCEKSKAIGALLDSLQKNDTKSMASIQTVKMDFFSERVKADSLLTAHGLTFVPAVILVDRKGKAYYKMSFDFNEQELPALRQGMATITQGKARSQP